MDRHGQGLPLLPLHLHYASHATPLHHHPLHRARRLRGHIREHLDWKFSRRSGIRRPHHRCIPRREPRHRHAAQRLRHQMRPRGQPMVCHHGRRCHLPYARQTTPPLHRRRQRRQPQGKLPRQQLHSQVRILQRLQQALRGIQRGPLLSGLEEEQLDLRLRQERDKQRLLLPLRADRPQGARMVRHRGRRMGIHPWRRHRPPHPLHHRQRPQQQRRGLHRRGCRWHDVGGHHARTQPHQPPDGRHQGILQRKRTAEQRIL